MIVDVAEVSEMNDKRHKRKSGYTVMIVSDSAEKNQKKFHINTSVLFGMAFLLFLAAVCYAEYTLILSHGATERSETYVEQISLLQTENEQLKAENEALQKEIANLNQNLSQKEALVQKTEESLQAAAQEKNMPKGLPVSGAAQIKETDGENDTGIQPDGERKEIILIAAVSTNITATGAGTVADVTQTEGEPACISIDHGNGYISMYRNAGAPKVTAGSLVEQGTALFEVEQGNMEVGYSVSRDGQYLDPMEIMEIKG